MKNYDQKDVVRINSYFYDQNNALADTTVAFRIKPGVLSATAPSFARISIGHYQSDVFVDYPGFWTYRWEGSGPITSADEGEFYVKPQSF